MVSPSINNLLALSFCALIEQLQQESVQNLYEVKLATTFYTVMQNIEQQCASPRSSTICLGSLPKLCKNTSLFIHQPGNMPCENYFRYSYSHYSYTQQKMNVLLSMLDDMENVTYH